MLIVSDTSPITNLIQIGQLEILKQLFGQIVIPHKVFIELSTYENHSKQLLNKKWITVAAAQNIQLINELKKNLDAGEAEAIALAKELNADLLIIDERKGRKSAEEHGLNIVGLLGVLVQAKKLEYLTLLKPILDQLSNEVGFRVSKELYDRILELGDE